MTKNLLALIALLAISRPAHAEDALTGALKQPNERGTVGLKEPVPGAATAGSADKTEASIKWLLWRVETAKVTFIRNGKASSGKTAARHMRRKFKNFRSDINTVDDFIRLTGTRSEVTGKPYLVETAPGRRMPSNVWLAEQLKEMP